VGGYKRLAVHLGQSPHDLYFTKWVSGESVGRFSTGVFNCHSLEAQDQDNEGKTKTKTAKILPQDEAVSRCFPSLSTLDCSLWSDIVDMSIRKTALMACHIYFIYLLNLTNMCKGKWDCPLLGKSLVLEQ